MTGEQAQHTQHAEQSQHKITLSIPRETWEAMNELARQHQRSFTKELVWALQAYVRREQREQREQRRKDEQ